MSEQEWAEYASRLVQNAHESSRAQAFNEAASYIASLADGTAKSFIVRWLLAAAMPHGKQGIVSR